MAEPRVLISLATYNERENLPALYGEIARHVPQADTLVIDDNSPDGTGQWCEEQAAADSRLKCLHRTGKLGLGTATLAAMRYAIDHDYDYLVNLDADLSHPPRYIPTLLDKMESHSAGPRDVMIGSRYVAGGKIEGWPWHRHVMSKLVNFYARTLLKLPVSDCSGAFRCYRVATLQRVDFDAVRSKGYSFQEEILWHLARLGAQFGETPITFVDRQHGQSKINLREAWLALAVIFRLAWGRPA